jgi:hypothetical protein
MQVTLLVDLIIICVDADIRAEFLAHKQAYALEL